MRHGKPLKETDIVFTIILIYVNMDKPSSDTVLGLFQIGLNRSFTLGTNGAQNILSILAID